MQYSDVNHYDKPPRFSVLNVVLWMRPSERPLIPASLMLLSAHKTTNRSKSAAYPSTLNERG